jgi:F-type H+-transporting ATPase subunit delta
MAKKQAGGLAPVYAEAMYDVAKEKGSLDRVAAEVAALAGILDKEPLLRRFFETPTVSAEDKRKVIEAGFKDFSAEVRNLLSVVVDRQRVGIFEKIAEAYHALANEKAGIAEVRLESVQALDAAAKERLGKVLERTIGKKIVFQEETRADLLGGFVLTHGDRQWNASLAHRLRQASRRMEGAKDALGIWKD